jgi:hypothetical protein
MYMHNKKKGKRTNVNKVTNILKEMVGIENLALDTGLSHNEEP